ncbi:hypothetical protein M8818_003996 [Zalaria obscura]|uniref:Uncharacterized protein n=1 Tax=Zalaria obscura TaxID=2024903 RepID=A0ACC3SF73_9PEZI
MSSSGQSAGQAIKGAFNQVHGVGEQIRGTVNSAADNAVDKGTVDDKLAANKNEAVANKGAAEVRKGEVRTNHV